MKSDEYIHAYPTARKSRKTNRGEVLVHPSQSILHTVCVYPPTRPYSQRELGNLLEKLYLDLHLADTVVCHPDCGHCYRVKKNGIRYKKLIETNGQDVGNCSVCWKVTKTPKELLNLVQEFMMMHSNDLETQRKTFFSYQVQSVFYTWLYAEMY